MAGIPSRPWLCDPGLPACEVASIQELLLILVVGLLAIWLLAVLFGRRRK